MKKILIATHGNFAGGILTSVELLTGTKEGITAVNAYMDGVDLEGEIRKFILNLTEEDVPIVFTDLYGGSVNQKVTKEFLEQKIPVMVVSGFNFPVLLEIILSSEQITQELLENLVEKSRREMNVQLLAKVETAEDEEDFF